jgi:hypothetical protein
VTKIVEWSEDRSRHECATAKSGGIPLVTETLKCGHEFTRPTDRPVPSVTSHYSVVICCF